MFAVPHDNTGKLMCVSSDDSDQLGHPSSPIRVLTIPKMFLLVSCEERLLTIENRL